MNLDVLFAGLAGYEGKFEITDGMIRLKSHVGMGYSGRFNMYRYCPLAAFLTIKSGGFHCSNSDVLSSRAPSFSDIFARQDELLFFVNTADGAFNDGPALREQLEAVLVRGEKYEAVKS